MQHCTDDQFYAILTSKRDESLAYLTDLVKRSGLDDFCLFLTRNLTPMVTGGDESLADIGAATQIVVAHMAIVGAVDAILSHRDSLEE